MKKEDISTWREQKPLMGIMADLNDSDEIRPFYSDDFIFTWKVDGCSVPHFERLLSLNLDADNVFIQHLLNSECSLNV